MQKSAEQTVRLYFLAVTAERVKQGNKEVLNYTDAGIGLFEFMPE